MSIVLSVIRWLAWSSPALPSANPMPSFWQREVADIADHSSDAALPDDILDFAIIGSGIAGASCALELLRSPEKPRIAIFEARTACGGATGRNGGMLATHPFVLLPDLVRTIGLDKAVAIIRFSFDNFKAVKAYILAEGIAEEVGLQDTRAAWCMTGSMEDWQKVKETYAFCQQHCPDLLDEVEILEAVEAESRLRAIGVFGAFLQTSGAVNAYKLVCHMLRSVVGQGVALYTHTPVLSIISTSGSIYQLKTSRGTLRARTVIHATNAYAPYLLPQLKTQIIPIRGQISVFSPPAVKLQSTYMLIPAGGDDHQEYMHQASPGGQVVWGGAASKSFETEVGTLNDEESTEKIATHLAKQPSRIFPGLWENAPQVEQVHVGISPSIFRILHLCIADPSTLVGFTSDRLPLIGEVLPNQFIISACNGAGMVQTVRSAFRQIEPLD